MAEETKVTGTETPEVDYKAKLEEMEAKYSSLKTSFDKTSSDYAELKRKERERMSEEDKRKVEDAEREAYYKGLEREISLSKYSEQLDDISDTKVKKQIVELLADGKIEEALTKHKEWRKKDRSEMEKKIREELMQTNPQPTAQSTVPTAKTKEEILAIKDMATRQKAIAENLHLFQ